MCLIPLMFFNSSCCVFLNFCMFSTLTLRKPAQCSKGVTSAREAFVALVSEKGLGGVGKKDPISHAFSPSLSFYDSTGKKEGETSLLLQSPSFRTKKDASHLRCVRA